MKRYLLLILLCVCSMCRMMAQDMISGKVVDENRNPLPYVSVVLQHVQDSSYVCGVTSDTEGVFRLPVQPDREYALLVSYIGYTTVRKTCKAGNLGTIMMKKDALMLEEVNVIASRIRHNANGYTVNLRSSDIVKGKQSADALAFLPGITKEDNSYKINGLPVSEIYVDGIKLANMDELKNLPADMIERVKVNYLAGSNQNAALTGGTIDISLRQPPQGGYYGSLSGGATLALAENLAGVASLALCPGKICVGISVSGHHVKAVAFGGTVTAFARLKHKGRTLHEWHIDITDQTGELISTVLVTNYVLTPRKNG